MVMTAAMCNGMAQWFLCVCKHACASVRMCALITVTVPDIPTVIE